MTDLKNLSTKMPPVGDISVIDVFEEAVLKYLACLRVHSKPNCTQTELEVIKSLENEKELIVKPSDKGGNTVILDRDQYLSMCKRLLDDKTCYEGLPRDPTEMFQKELLGILETSKRNELINHDEFDFLYPRFPRVVTFYSLPKHNKRLSPLKGRPIVSGIDCLSQNCGVHIDHILRPFVETLPSYVRDTTPLLQRLECINIEKDHWLASVDVEALYTHLAISQTRRALMPCPIIWIQEGVSTAPMDYL